MAPQPPSARHAAAEPWRASTTDFWRITMPLTHETATALDPQAKAVIDLVIKSGRPPYHHLSPKDARQMFRETRPASTPTPPEIGEVKDLRAEQIPCRVYRPKGVPPSTALPALIFFHGG